MHHSSSSLAIRWRVLLSVFFLLERVGATQGPFDDDDPTLVRLLRRVKSKTGWQPNAIIDVGANFGYWSREARKLFPSSKILMIEATPYQEQHLKKISMQIKNAEYKMAVVSSQDNETVKFFQDGNTGNSIFRENSIHYEHMVPVERSAFTLDTLIADSFLRDEPIDVIKADVQGAELAVFQGASKALSQASFLYFEASTVEYNQGAPCFNEIDEYLRSKGYLFFDLGNMEYNDALKTIGLAQYDVLYFRPDSTRLPDEIRKSGTSYCGYGRRTTTTKTTTTPTSSLTQNDLPPSSSRRDESKIDLMLVVCQSWAAGVMCGIFTTLLAIRWLKQWKSIGTLVLPFHP